MKPYKYTESGLDNIYLLSGFEEVDTAYGKAVKIELVDELHKAIGMSLIDSGRLLSGQEIRFLRVEMDISQRNLAALLSVDVQSVGRWERGENPVSGPADRLIRSFYLEHVREDSDIRKLCEILSEIDNNELDSMGENIKKFERNDEWHRAA